MDTPPRHPVLEPFFRRIVGLRWVFVVVYALLVPPALWAVLSIPQDSAIERMVVRNDADYVATRAFQEVFPEPKRAILVLEAPDPFAPQAIAALQRLEAALARVHRVQAVSVLTVYQRLDPAAAAAPGVAEALRRFASGTDFFRRQGLVGDGFLGVMLALDVGGPDERDAALAAVDHALEQAGLGPTPADGSITAVRRVGGPFVDAWLERETARSSLRYFPLFGLFVVALVYGLYRSFRALTAILLTLAVGVLLGVAVGALLGYGFTIISSLVPLTLMVTATASLVYLHSRYVDHPPGVPMAEHQVFALANKFLAVTVSIFAAAVGFAALLVSQIRPIRELGTWTALGLGAGWVVCFTLFPALQRVFRTPGVVERRVAGGWVEAAAERIPRWSYRWRRPLVLGSVLLMLLGAGALFGVPGVLAPMPLQVAGLDYVDRRLPVYRDTRWFGENVLGLSQVSAWITTPPGAVLDPQTLAAVDRFARALAEQPEVGAATGLTEILRLRRYAAGEGDALPTAPEAQAAMAADLEQLLLTEPALRGFVDMNTLGATHVTVVARRGAEPAEGALPAAVERAWARASGD
ncbi:MAG: exporter of the superfamily protein-like protein, partial [Acidobacteria bacterium]|nr:exporter of the superfamily protein-like protein [Acidobacteriota bacterium]